MKKYGFKFFLLLASVVLLFGCAHKITTTYTEANDAYKQTEQTIAADKADANKLAPSAITKKAAYAETKPLTPEQQAFWLKNNISVNAHALPMSFLVSQILRKVNVQVKYDPDVKRGQLVSLTYSGNIQGALDAITQRTGYGYIINEDGLLWSNFITKTFNIAFMPGTSTYLVGGATNIGAGTSSGTTGTTGTGTTGTAAGTSTSSGSSGGGSDSQYSSLQASLSIWDDIRNTLDGLKSKDGKVTVSQSTTSVTVSDHPSNVAAMERYITSLNQEMSRQVKLQVRVLELDLDKEHQYGVDWDVIRSFLNTHFHITSQLATTAATAAAGGATTIAPMALQIGTTSNAIIRALSTQGKVSIVTEPTATTLNNQVAEIRISRDTAYIASTTQSVTPVTTGGITSTSMQPGTVSAGFTLYLVPKIQGSQVYLQVSSTLSTLEGIKSITSGKKETNNYVQIDLPTMAEKRFNMRSLLENNETLVIGGFKQTSNATQENKPFGIKALGGEGASHTSTETIILITPTIAESRV